MREQADGEATEANPNAGKQIEGGTTEFYLLLGEDQPQMPIALPLKTEGSEDVDRGRQGWIKTGEGGGPGGGAALSQRQIIYFIAILRSIGID